METCSDYCSYCKLTKTKAAAQSIRKDYPLTIRIELANIELKPDDHSRNEPLTSLCLRERHLTLISKQVLCAVSKTSTGLCFTMAYTGEKNEKKQVDIVLLVFLKVDLAKNCLMLNLYDAIPRVKRTNKYNNYQSTNHIQILSWSALMLLCPAVQKIHKWSILKFALSY